MKRAATVGGCSHCIFSRAVPGCVDSAAASSCYMHLLSVNDGFLLPCWFELDAGSYTARLLKVYKSIGKHVCCYTKRLGSSTMRIKSTENNSKSVPAPALTPEGRDDQLAALAYNLAEKKLRDGTASNSLIESLMKNSSQKAQLEIEKLKRENELLTAKVRAIEASARTEELYAQVMRAIKEYRGEDDLRDDETVGYY